MPVSILMVVIPRQKGPVYSLRGMVCRRLERKGACDAEQSVVAPVFYPFQIRARHRPQVKAERSLAQACNGGH